MGEYDVGHMKKEREKLEGGEGKKGRWKTRRVELKWINFTGWWWCETIVSALKNDSIFIVEEEWLKRIEEVKGSN
jgi:hypothetical protein